MKLDLAVWFESGGADPPPICIEWLRAGIVYVYAMVRVAVGPMAGLVVDSFRFCFEVLAADDSLTRDTSLEIDIPLPSYCLTVWRFEGRQAASAA
jgi:Zn finger protein HypA/HybF involved in hydrogenase expression